MLPKPHQLTAPTVADLVFLTELATLKPSFKHDALHDALPAMHAATASINPVLLTVPIFSVARASAGNIDAVWRRKGQGYVHYRGPALSQSHLTLMLSFIKRRAGLTASVPFFTTPTELLRSIGWSENSRNQSRLIDLLDELKAAQLTLWQEGEDERTCGTRTGLLLRWKPSEAGAWEFQLDGDIVNLFQGALTYLNVRKRALLREGLATFLYGYISANSCKLPFTYAELHAASGSMSRDMKEFGKSIRAALDQLLEHGLIKGYSADRGAVRVSK